MKTIHDIKHAFYINLESRPDRKQHVENQLNSIGINATRFNACKTQNGAIGCSISHIKCLQTAIENHWDHILICEDDITFLKPLLFKTQLNKFLEKNDGWDVILLAGNNVPPYKQVDDTCVQVYTCQTTTGYIVNGHYIERLLHNVRTGLMNLFKTPSRHNVYAIDRFWFHLQKVDKWFLIIPLTVIQQVGYSDIENKNTDYSGMMIDLDKAVWLSRKKKHLV